MYADIILIHQLLDFLVWLSGMWACLIMLLAFFHDLAFSPSEKSSTVTVYLAMLMSKQNLRSTIDETMGSQDTVEFTDEHVMTTVFSSPSLSYSGTMCC